MKNNKMFLFVAALFSFTINHVEILAAKAAYCNDALGRCLDICGGSLCEIGCYVGYLGCG